MGVAEVTEERFRALYLKNGEILSRTIGGVVDTATSKSKVGPKIAADEIAAVARRNDDRAISLAWAAQYRDPIPDGEALLVELLALNSCLAAGLVPVGKVFREWEIKRPESVPVDQLALATERLCNVAARRLVDARNEPGMLVELASWVEFDLNAGGLHPFYDGCGRVSRLFAARLLATGGVLYPLWESRQKYFLEANLGLKNFSKYFNSRLAPASAWVGSREFSVFGFR